MREGPGGGLPDPNLRAHAALPVTTARVPNSHCNGVALISMAAPWIIGALIYVLGAGMIVAGENMVKRSSAYPEADETMLQHLDG